MKLRTNIERIKMLTETLVDRDSVRLKIISLFDKFCNDFPIPMDAWIVDENLKFISKNGQEIKKEISVYDIFSDASKDKNIEMHKRALSGECVTYTILDNDTTFLTKLIPAEGISNMVFGISMNVTSFVNLAAALEHHCKDIESSECDLIKRVKNDSLYSAIIKGDLDE